MRPIYELMFEYHLFYLAFILTVGDPQYNKQSLSSWAHLNGFFDYTEEAYSPEIKDMIDKEVDKMQDMLDQLVEHQKDNVIKYLRYFFQL